MPLDAADIQEINDLRKKILDNIENEKPEYEGIDAELLKKCIENIRGKRNAIKPPKTTGKKAEPGPSLDELFAKKK